MKVVLFGASGFSGQAVLQQLLDQNHEVTAVTRSASRINLKDRNLHVYENEHFDNASLQAIVNGQDAVINCLGIGGKGSGTPNNFVSTATSKIVKSMEENGVKRFICLSNIGAGSSYATQPWVFKKILLPYFLPWLKHIIDDKNIMEPVIMNSSLDWTIVRCPNIVEKLPKGKIKKSLTGKGLKFSITNKDLAILLVDQLADSSFSRKAVSVSN